MPYSANLTTGKNTTVTGTNATVTSTNGNVTGTNATVTGTNGNVTGTNATATGTNGNVTGTNAIVTGTNGNVIGKNANATGTNAIAMIYTLYRRAISASLPIDDLIHGINYSIIEKNVIGQRYSIKLAVVERKAHRNGS